MQLTINHWMVLVLPVITFFFTFFLAEEFAKQNQYKQKYQWNPIRLHLIVIVIMCIGTAVSIALGYLSYAVIFNGFPS